MHNANGHNGTKQHKAAQSSIRLNNLILRAQRQKRYRKLRDNGRAIIKLECNKEFKRVLIVLTTDPGNYHPGLNVTADRLLQREDIQRFFKAIVDLEMMLVV
jgi:hypothetical protein